MKSFLNSHKASHFSIKIPLSLKSNQDFNFLISNQNVAFLSNSKVILFGQICPCTYRLDNSKILLIISSQICHQINTETKCHSIPHFINDISALSAKKDTNGLGSNCAGQLLWSSSL